MFGTAAYGLCTCLKAYMGCWISGFGYTHVCIAFFAGWLGARHVLLVGVVRFSRDTFLLGLWNQNNTLWVFVVHALSLKP